MDTRMDEQVMEKLVEAMARAKSFRVAQELKREARLWAEINVPCRLKEVLSGLTKNEMDAIRKYLDLKNLSTLRKQELAGELLRRMPEHAWKVFLLFDKERYRLAKRISQNDGFVYESSLTLEKVEHLRKQGVIFTGSKDGKKILAMPLEILEKFREMDTVELKKLANRNTEWIRLTHGLLYYYGVMNLNKLEDMLEKLTGERPDTTQYMNVLMDAAGYYEQIKPAEDGYGFCDFRVFDTRELVQEQKARPGIDYYPFTREQLLKAGEEGYVERSPAFIRFTNFLLQHYELAREEADEIAEQCTHIIQSNGKPGEIMEYLGQVLEFPSFEFVQQLTAEVVQLSNNTRLWVLKGHTPAEVFQEEKQHLRPLPAMPFSAVDSGTKVVNMRTRTKVGRNDPCPCGSGKKFKKCCGK